MEYEFLLPKGIQAEELTDSYGRFVFMPLERGYGVTIGNALRRVLLSSIEGAAIVGIRIDGVLHEFTTIPGVLEEVPQIILNLKKVRLKIDNPDVDSATLRIRAEGKRELKSGDIEAPDTVTIVTKDIHIATLTTDDARLYAELFVRRGRGYVPTEEMPQESFPVNTILIDAIFSPIRKVNFTVENVRVRARTDYEKLILEIWTDGTIRPDEALRKAAEIIREAMNRVLTVIPEEVEKPETKELDEEQKRIKGLLEKGIEYLELSKRMINCLNEAGIKTIADLVSKSEEDMLTIKNFGGKSLNELKEKLQKFGLSFGMDVDKYLKLEEEAEAS